MLNSNAVPLLDKDRSYHGIFDLCIESLSDFSEREVERDTVTKRAEYAAAGVRAERERAEQAEQLAARYAALLKSMGVDVDNLPAVTP